MLLPLLLLSAPAHASGEAEEAEATFQLGAKAYVEERFEDALAWFLASNRLAPNPSVAFNIARCYARSGKYAEAWRWLDTAERGLTDAKVLASIEDEKGRIRPQVVLWDVRSEPPGADVYVDRKDLGSVGSTPLTLALSPRSTPPTFLLEKDGHSPVTQPGVAARAGESRAVQATLPLVVGAVGVQAPEGTEVRLGSPEGPLLCTAPCEAQVPPGDRVLHFRKDGFRDTVRQLVVVADQRVTTTVELQPDTGSVVVDTTERGARVEIDGVTVGFTPTVVGNVPVGVRTLRVSRTGYAPVEREVEVTSDEQVTLSGIELVPLNQVSAVSRRTEDLALAPSSVTVLTNEELKAFRYPTIYEALRGVRGVALSYDSIYGSAAVRGLGQQNDFGNRLLVLSDGATLNDNVLFQSFISYDGRTDLGDVERIEVVRGPGSVLYGTGAVSGVVNLVGNSLDTPEGTTFSVGAFDDAVVRGRAETHQQLGERSGFRASVSGAGSQGTDVTIDPRAPAVGATPLEGFDAFVSGSTAGRVWVGDGTVQWFHTIRTVDIPTGVYGTVLGNPNGVNEWTDQRTLLEARYEPSLSETTTLLTRAWFNRYVYDGVLPYGAYTSVERYQSLSAGAEARVILEPDDAIRVQAGALLDATPVIDLAGEDQARDGTVTPYLDASNPYAIAAAYVLGDLVPVDTLRITAGARVDYWSTFGVAASPRLAVVAVPDEGDVLKLMAGRAFRAPSIYELSYTIPGVQVAPQGLGPETVWSGELEYSHAFDPWWTALLAGHGSLAQNLVETVDAPGGGGVTYENSDLDIRIVGADLELRRAFHDGLMFSTFYSLLESRYADGTAVPNVPLHSAGAKLIAPIALPQARIALRAALEAPRRIDLSNEDQTGLAVISDLVLSGGVPEQRLEYAAGVYNLFDMAYAQPVGDLWRFRTLPQRGRTLMATLSLGF